MTSVLCSVHQVASDSLHIKHTQGMCKASPLHCDMLIIDSLNQLGDAPLLPEHLQGQGVQPDQAGQGQQGFGAAAGILVM